jgi:hypothetical protein
VPKKLLLYGHNGFLPLGCLLGQFRVKIEHFAEKGLPWMASGRGGIVRTAKGLQQTTDIPNWA